MNKNQSLILTALQIEQKVVRMAHEIHEHNHKEKEIILIGITGRGMELAERIHHQLCQITSIPITLESITLDKDQPLGTSPMYSGQNSSLKNKTVILIDDVLNSGRTLIFATKYLLNTEPKSLAIATLVDRYHRRFPIRANYVGLTLSTNLKEHVTVVLDKGMEAVYLA
jgi:pyrimidine operon attenuation protein / uracil phosphoribosyltransferase